MDHKEPHIELSIDYDLWLHHFIFEKPVFEQMPPSLKEKYKEAEKLLKEKYSFNE